MPTEPISIRPPLELSATCKKNIPYSILLLSNGKLSKSRLEGIPNSSPWFSVISLAKNAELKIIFLVTVTKV